MRKRVYIFKRKTRDKRSSRAIFVSMLGLLVLAPPAIAQSPGLRPAHHASKILEQPPAK